MTPDSIQQDKQITIEVPEDRVAEFYAFYGRFLSGFSGRRRHGHGPRGHRCASRRDRVAAEEQTGASGPEVETV